MQLNDIRKKIMSFPTLPGVAVRLLEVFQKEAPSTREITEIISTDAPLTLKVLRAVNSPFYGLRNQIISVGQAVTLLGLNSVKNLALSFSLISALCPKKKAVFDYTQFWKDSIIGGLSAKILAECIDKRHSESAFLIGLLQDIGSLILAENFPDAYKHVYDRTLKNGLTTAHAETLELGLDHMAVGRYLLQTWGFPPAFLLPIGWHHAPDDADTAKSEGGFESLILVLHLSSLVIDLFRKSGRPVDFLPLTDALVKYGLEKVVDKTQLAERVSDSIQSIFPIFELEVDADRCFEIIESSKAELSDLADTLITQVDLQKGHIEELTRQTGVDGLTQLNNQRRFYEILQQEISRAARYKTPLALIMADVDYFKSVNDFYGHLVGDKVLKTMASALKSALRDSDHIARYGGEEFAVILPLTPLEGAMLVAERLRVAVGGLKVPHDQKAISVSMSFGVAAVDGTARVGVENFIRMADEALYEAKEAGRDRCQAYRQKINRAGLPTILVIDDESVVLVTVTKMLAKLGYSAVTAEDGPSTVAQCQIQASNIKVVLLDVLMPGINTLDTIGAIKSICPQSKVIISSGFEKNQIRSEILKKSDGYIGKPYSLIELQSVIDDCLA